MVIEVGFDFVIEGEVAEKAAAQQSYDLKAISNGHGAFLFSQNQEETDLYRMSVGNIGPNINVIVRISYISECLSFSMTTRTIRFLLGAHCDILFH